MANLKVKDSDAAVQEIKATGAGSTGDPLVLARAIAGPLGRAADAASVSVALSTEDVAFLDGLESGLASILAKLLTAPSTEAKQDAGIALLTTQAGYLDGLETLLTAIDGHVDGLESVEGTTADAAVVTDTTGTFSGKLRGLVKWAFERMPAALGQGTKAQSLPVVLPSDYGVAGDVAAAAADSGNPVKVGGKYNSTKPTYTNGQRGDMQLEINGGQTVALYGQVTNPGDTPIKADSSGNIRVTPYNANTAQSFGSSAGDALSNGFSGFWSFCYTFLFNGTTWDRPRNNNAVTGLASAARTATANADVVTYNARTFRVTLNITAAPNTASTLTLAIRVKDSISGNYVTLLTGAAETGSVDTGAVPVTKTYSVGAGVVATANISSPEALARTMNVIVTHSNSDSWTYSVSVDLGV